MVFETILQSDLQKMVNVKQLTGNLFSADNGGNKITVEILDGGAPATVSGSVYGYAIREDEKTVVIEGTLSGNKASIVLPASAYAVIGKLNIVIKVGTATVGACSAYVYRTTTDAIVDPGSVVPDISELLAQIGACEEATTAANTAATAANTAAANVGGNLAANYSTSAAYAVGDYCIKDGTLYRCTTAITSGENWNSSHWTAAKIGPDVSALKSALIPNNLIVAMESGSYSATDGVTKETANTRIRNVLPVKTHNIVSFSCPSGYTFRTLCLSKSMALLSNEDWTDKKTTASMPSGTEYVNFVIRKTSATTSDISADVMTIENGFVVSTIEKNTLITIETEQADIKPTVISNNIVVAMESGTYDATDSVTKVANNTRIRNIMPVKASVINNLVCPSGYDAIVHYLNKNLEKISYSGWNVVHNKNSFPSGTEYVNIIIRKISAPSSDISSDVITVEDGFVINKELPILEEGIVLIHSESITGSTKTISLQTHTDYGYIFELINESQSQGIISGIYYVNNKVANSDSATLNAGGKFTVEAPPAGSLDDVCSFRVDNANTVTVQLNVYLKLSTHPLYNFRLWQTTEFQTTYVSTAAGSNQRIFLTRGLIKGTKLKSVTVYSRSDTENGTLLLEIWGVSSGSLVKRGEKSTTFGTTVGNVTISAINYTCTDDITFCSINYIPNEGSLNYALGKISDHDTRGVGSYVTNDTESTTLDMFTPFGNPNDNVMYVKYTPYVRFTFDEPNYRKNGDYIIVGENGDFTDLQKAIYCTDEGTKIVLMPGKYEGSFHCAGQTRFIEGISRDDCIIVDHKADYYAPPLEMNVGALRRVTIISDATDVDTSAEGANLAYCVHCDFEQNSYDNSMIFEDCKMINANRPCIGAGLHQNYTMIVKDCDFMSGVHVEAEARGALYFHTKNTAGITNQHAEIHNTKVHCADEVAVTVMPLQNGQGTAEFIGCSIYSDINGHSDAVIWDGTDTSIFDSNFKLSPLSHGNNVSSVNAP